jgi:hypothetical protein
MKLQTMATSLFLASVSRRTVYGITNFFPNDLWDL